MMLIYMNDYINEHHGSPSAYLFFLKLFSRLQYPMLTFHYFHPFHPRVTFDRRRFKRSASREQDVLRCFVFRSKNFPEIRFFQLAPTYREEGRALISLMERYDWNTFSFIIDPRLPGEKEIIEEFEKHGEVQRNEFDLLV